MTQVTNAEIDKAVIDITRLFELTRKELWRRLRLIAEVPYLIWIGDLERARTALLAANAHLDLPSVRIDLDRDEDRYQRIMVITKEKFASRVTSDSKGWAQGHLLDGEGLPQRGEIWRHQKGGLYTVVTMAVMENTLDPLVIYHSNERGTDWGRTFDDWMEVVTNPKGISVPRFRRYRD